MRHVESFTATLHSVERVQNSASGIPRYLIHTSEGTFKTECNGSINYDIERLTHPRHENLLGNVVVIHTHGKRRQIWNITPVSE